MPTSLPGYGRRDGPGQTRKELLGARQALVGDHRRSLGWPVGRPGRKQQPGVLAFAIQLGVGQPEAGHRPLAGGDQQQPAAPVEAVMRGVVAAAGVASEIRARRGGPRAAAEQRGAIGKPQPLGRIGGSRPAASAAFGQRTPRPRLVPTMAGSGSATGRPGVPALRLQRGAGAALVPGSGHRVPLGEPGAGGECLVEAVGAQRLSGLG